jgi:hypothetical protein
MVPRRTEQVTSPGEHLPEGPRRRLRALGRTVKRRTAASSWIAEQKVRRHRQSRLSRPSALTGTRAAARDPD